MDPKRLFCDHCCLIHGTAKSWYISTDKPKMNKLYGISTLIVLLCYLTNNNVCGAPGRGFRKHSVSAKQRTQCPINIIRKTAIEIPADSPLPVFKTTPIHFNNVTITNTGTTVQIRLSGADEIFLKSDFANYKFAQAHFHWGKNDYSGSETHIDSTRFPLEMHLVFFNSDKFTSFEVAAKGDTHTDLVVMTVLFKISEEDQPMFEFTNRLNELEHPHSTIHYDFKNKDILPENIDEFYEFEGSLTTPPYSEITTWIVYPDTLFISSKQLKQFRLIHNAENRRISSNWRNLQKVEGRAIYH